MAMSQSGSVCGSLLLPRIECDSRGSFNEVECGSVSGQLYIDRLPKERAKCVGQCVLSSSKWFTPLEFEKLGGKSAKKWKSSLFHAGHPLSDYSLVCSTAVPPTASSTSNVATQADGTMILLLSIPTSCSEILLLSIPKSCSGSHVKKSWRVLALCSIRDVPLIKGSR